MTVKPLPDFPADVPAPKEASAHAGSPRLGPARLIRSWGENRRWIALDRCEMPLTRLMRSRSEGPVQPGSNRFLFCS
jgi:hypothetical protein